MKPPRDEGMPSADALALIAEKLDWGKHRRPTKAQANELARYVDKAIADGWLYLISNATVHKHLLKLVAADSLTYEEPSQSTCHYHDP